MRSPKKIISLVLLQLLLAGGCGVLQPSSPYDGYAAVADSGRGQRWLFGVQPDLRNDHGFVQDRAGRRASLPHCEVDSGYAAPVLSRSGSVIVVVGCLGGRKAQPSTTVIRDGRTLGSLPVEGAGAMSFVGDDSLLIPDVPHPSGSVRTVTVTVKLLEYSLEKPATPPRAVAGLTIPATSPAGIFDMDVEPSRDRVVVTAGSWKLAHPNDSPQPLPDTGLWVLSLRDGHQHRVPEVQHPEKAKWASDGRLIVQMATRWVTVDPGTGRASAFADRPADSILGGCDLVGVAQQRILAWCPGGGRLLEISAGGSTSERARFPAGGEVSVAVDALD